MAFWLLLVVTAFFLARWLSVSNAQLHSVRGDVLFVFAHPDDEAMFFSPTILYLTQQGINCHFLCLSNGNFNGLGQVRESELHASAAYFGIQKRNVRVVNHPELQDGAKETWPAALIMKEVDAYLAKAMQISTVITFDKDGVSSHPNHIAVHEGVKKLKNSMPPGINFLQLKTRGLLWKYTGLSSLVLPVTLSSRGNRKRFSVIIPPTAVHTSFSAMRRHSSQLVWFRYLFVAFSSYTYLNELGALDHA